MKMKFWDRIILRIGAVLTFLGGVLTAVCGAMIYGMNLGEGIVMQSIPLTLICAGVVIALISLYNLLMPRRYHNGRHAFVVQPTEMGELRIAVSAIENLILKCVETHKEVKVQDIAITNRRGAVSVQLRVTMDSNVSIPHAVEQIQTQVKRYLAASSSRCAISAFPWIARRAKPVPFPWKAWCLTMKSLPPSRRPRRKRCPCTSASLAAIPPRPRLSR